VPYGEMVERYDESLEILFAALESGGEPISYDGKYFQVHDARVVPPPTRRFRVFTGGTSDKTYILAATKGWGVVVPPLLPYEALREQLDLYRTTCAEHGNEPDIVWIHACYLDEDRDTALREAEAGIKGFLAGNASPLVEHEKPPAEELTGAGYRFHTAGIPAKLADTPYDQMTAGDLVRLATPDVVSPRGVPSASSVVTIATPAGYEAMISTKVSRSTGTTERLRAAALLEQRQLEVAGALEPGVQRPPRRLRRLRDQLGATLDGR